MKKLIPVLIFFICLPGVFGALQVKSFSCDSSVLVDGSLNCQAEITDTSSSATISNVILYLPVGDEWAEQTSYTGSGYKSNISQGEATTATFSITPIIAGEHSFDYVKINDVTDTNIDYSAITVNVLSIRSLGITAPSYASLGEEFSVSSSILAGGNLESVLLTISASGCSLKSGESSSKSLGSMSDGTQGSKSWVLTQGTGDCSFTITATATGGVSQSIAGTVSGPSSDTTGVGGGGPAIETKVMSEIGRVEIIIPSISPGEIKTVEIPEARNVYISNLSLSVNKKASNVKITITTLSSYDSEDVKDVGGELFHYNVVDFENIDNEDINDVTFGFKVKKTWIVNKNINEGTVVLSREYNGSWNKLLTTRTGTNNEFFYYSSTSPGF